jgi:hypothetical protein
MRPAPRHREPDERDDATGGAEESGHLDVGCVTEVTVIEVSQLHDRTRENPRRFPMVISSHEPGPEALHGKVGREVTNSGRLKPPLPVHATQRDSCHTVED